MLRFVTLASAALAMGLLHAPMAQANSVTRLLGRSGLVQQDIDIMVREASQLYLGGRATPGDDTVWSNPATGAHGMAEITGVDGACVDIAYKFRTRTRPNEQVVTLRRCKSGNQWVLAN